MYIVLQKFVFMHVWSVDKNFFEVYIVCMLHILFNCYL